MVKRKMLAASSINSIFILFQLVDGIGGRGVFESQGDGEAEIFYALAGRVFYIASILNRYGLNSGAL